MLSNSSYPKHPEATFSRGDLSLEADWTSEISGGSENHKTLNDAKTFNEDSIMEFYIDKIWYGERKAKDLKIKV